MRIVGGSVRGRGLRAPKGLTTRPTPARVRESVFDILGQRCDDLRVLDLFSGTGALGLEALSRGAAHCEFVERDGAALVALKHNVTSLGFERLSRIRRGDALALDCAGGPFDLVFADPPYSHGGGPVVRALGDAGPDLLVPGGRVVVEHGVRETLSERCGVLTREDERRYGDTKVTFYSVNDG